MPPSAHDFFSSALASPLASLVVAVTLALLGLRALFTAFPVTRPLFRGAMALLLVVALVEGARAACAFASAERVGAAGAAWFVLGLPAFFLWRWLGSADARRAAHERVLRARQHGRKRVALPPPTAPQPMTSPPTKGTVP